VQRRDSGEFAVVDLGSRNGSFVNNRRVTLPVILADLDRIVFGDQELRFRQATAPQSGIFEPNLDTRNAPTTAMHAHRLATIVVVDIRDFTPLARSISESLLSQTIGTWFLRVGQIVQGLGSWGQRYIGDAVMAVWVHDDPEQLRRELLRSLRAVSDIETATGEISQSLPLPGPLRIGAGVNTGSAIIGGSDYTAMGDTVNAAFRLESATKLLGLNVALGDRTYAEIAGNAAPFERRMVELKGYEGPSTAWATSFELLREFLRTLGD
jgi:adenylate cyclase